MESLTVLFEVNKPPSQESSDRIITETANDLIDDEVISRNNN